MKMLSTKSGLRYFAKGSPEAKAHMARLRALQRTKKSLRSPGEMQWHKQWREFSHRAAKKAKNPVVADPRGTYRMQSPVSLKPSQPGQALDVTQFSGPGGTMLAVARDVNPKKKRRRLVKCKRCGYYYTAGKGCDFCPGVGKNPPMLVLGNPLTHKEGQNILASSRNALAFAQQWAKTGPAGQNRKLLWGWGLGHAQALNSYGKAKRDRVAAGEILLREDNPGGPLDPAAAHELRLYIDNDGDLYRQQTTPIMRNLMKKIRKGVYDHTKAIRLWEYLAESGAKKYVKEFGGGVWHVMFSPATRRQVAKEMADHFKTEADLGAHRTLNPRRPKLLPGTEVEQLHCQYCGGQEFVYLGQTGKGHHAYRCRRCGMDKVRQEWSPSLWGGNPGIPRRRVRVLSRSANPGELPSRIANDPAFKREVRAFTSRHGSGPIEVIRVRVPKGFPRYMSSWGTSPHVVYDAPKHSNKGKRIHHFGERGGSRPFLVSSASWGPKGLAYVGGTFRGNGRWIYK